MLCPSSSNAHILPAGSSFCFPLFFQQDSKVNKLLISAQLSHVLDSELVGSSGSARREGQGNLGPKEKKGTGDRLKGYLITPTFLDFFK